MRQLFAADDFNRRHFSDAFFLCSIRVKRAWVGVYVCGGGLLNLLTINRRLSRLQQQSVIRRV